MNTINVIHHMNELRNVFSYASNIGFFFGAGTSCAFGLPNITQLTDSVKEQLDSAQKEIINNLEKTIKDLNGKAALTIEDLLNYIREIRSLTNDRADYDFNGVTGVQAKELDQLICRLIFKIIKSGTENADIKELRRFFGWYETVNRGFIKEIYTCNYDMLLEMAMEANRTVFYDGFSGSYEPFFSPDSLELFPGENDSTNNWIRLWKLHGSLNWLKKPASALSTAHIIRVSKSSDEPKNELMIYPSRDKYNLSRKEPYIAYFDRFKKYLNQGELVFIICGYSFGDEHINEIIFNSLRNNNRLYVLVLCYGDDQVDSMAAYATSFINLCVMGPTKLIANGSLKKWVYVASEEMDIGSGMYWDDNRFMLGDFKKFIDFLIENSGRKNVIEEIVDAK